MISFHDEDPDDKKEREEQKRGHPHLLRLTDGERDVALQLVRYALDRVNTSTARATAMEQDDLTGLRQKLEAS